MPILLIPPQNVEFFYGKNTELNISEKSIKPERLHMPPFYSLRFCVFSFPFLSFSSNDGLTDISCTDMYI